MEYLCHTASVTLSPLTLSALLKECHSCRNRGIEEHGSWSDELYGRRNIAFVCVNSQRRMPSHKLLLYKCHGFAQISYTDVWFEEKYKNWNIMRHNEIMNYSEEQFVYFMITLWENCFDSQRESPKKSQNCEVVFHIFLVRRKHGLRKDKLRWRRELHKYWISK